MSSVFENSSSQPQIQPPPELRELVNSTAEFIRQKGLQVEDQLRERKAHDIRFGFLQSNNPYHVYYRRRVEQGDEAETHQNDGGNVVAALGEVKSTVLEETKSDEPKVPARRTLSQRLKAIVDRHTPRLPETHVEELPAKPDDDASAREFSVFPVRVRDMDLDVIRETALYSSVNGGRFVGNLLSQRFNDVVPFVRPTHPLFPLYKQYTDAYSKIVNVDSAAKTRVKSDVDDHLSALFDNLVLVAQHQHQDEQTAVHEAMQQAQELALSRQVDWTSFTLVESITFDPAEDATLPEPLGSIQAVDEFVRMQEVVVAERLAYEQSKVAGVETDSSEVAYEPMALESMLGEGIEIRSGIDTSLLAGGAAKKSSAPVTCPVCSQQVPAAELQEHMRIELQDPQWRAQKKSLEQRHLLSGSVTGADLAKNALGGLSTTTTTQANIGPQVDAAGMKRKMDLYVQQQQQQQQQMFQQQPVYESTDIPMEPMMKRPKLLDPHKQSILESAMLPMPVFDDVVLPSEPTKAVTDVPTIAAATTTATTAPPSSTTLVNEQTWLEQHAGTATCYIEVPKEENSAHNFNGQTLTIELPSLASTVLELKQAISTHLNSLAPNKMKICIKNGNFLNKDTSSLAAYNASNVAFFEVGHRVRGGKKV